MRRNPLFWGILGLALVVGLVTTLDRYQRQGRIFAGFWVMENLLVAVGGPERGPFQPFDVVRVMNGQVVRSGRDIQAMIESQDPGARFQYIVYRRGELVETEVPTRLYTRRDFLRFVVESLLPGTLQLAIGAVVFLIRPGRPQSWLFLVFTLVAYLVTVTYGDAHTTYRFSGLFLTAWAFWPATLVHLALTFPQRRGILRRFPRVVWLPYLVSAVVALLLQLPFVQADVRFLLAVPAVAAAYWGVALLLLVLSLARASVVGGSPLIRQRARVLCAAFVLGYVPPILGTVVEALFQVRVPYLNALWRLTLLFPVVMAYAMVRYDLFDVRAAIRAGAAYSAATGLVVLGYTGAIAAMDLLLTNWEASQSPIVVAGIMAVLVVVVLNPLYLRSQRLVDRLFFRQRVDVQRSIEGVSEVMSGVLDLRRIAELLGQTVDEQLHPEQQELYLLDAHNPRYVRADLDDDEGEARPPIDAASALVRSLETVRQPMTRARVEEDPGLDAYRAECLEAMDALGATLVVPFVFQGRVTGFLALGPKRSSLGYSGQDVGLLRLLANSSALALEHARAYAALEATNAELDGDGATGGDPGEHPDEPRQVRAANRPGPDRARARGAGARQARGRRHRAVRRPGRLHAPHRAPRPGPRQRARGAVLRRLPRRDPPPRRGRERDRRRRSHGDLPEGRGSAAPRPTGGEVRARDPPADARAERGAPGAARADRRPRRRELGRRHGRGDEDRGRQRHPMDLHRVRAGHDRGGPSGGAGERGRGPRGRRHPGAAGRGVLLRLSRRAGPPERRGAGVGVPAGAARDRSRHRLTRARVAQPRPIDQKSAPKRSHGSRHSSVRSGSGVNRRLTA